MTTQPATLSLNAAEWRGLLVQNLVMAHERALSVPVIGEGEALELLARLDRMKALVNAWHRSAPQKPVQQAVEQIQPEPPAPVQTNGAAPKRGGWPKGKPRKRTNPMQVVQ